MCYEKDSDGGFVLQVKVEQVVTLQLVQGSTVPPCSSLSTFCQFCSSVKLPLSLCLLITFAYPFVSFSASVS